jgi:hypothetical protein
MQFRAATSSLPGAERMWRSGDDLQTGLLQGLKQRLDDLEQAPSDLEALYPEAEPAELFNDLLHRSVSQQPDTAKTELFLRLVEQLVPDEARLIAALSDGSRRAICHLDATNMLGTSSTRMLSHVSRLGVECGVMLAEHTHVYLGHLQALGLLLTAPEDKSLGTQYELIETDSRVREVIRHIETDLQLRPRISRQTIALSPLGGTLWSHCQSAGTPEGPA